MGANAKIIKPNLAKTQRQRTFVAWHRRQARTKRAA